MPVVLRANGFIVRFYSLEHDPPHVHVRYGGAGAVIDIATGHVRASGMRAHDLARACALVRDHREALLSAWFAWKLNREGTA